MFIPKKGGKNLKYVSTYARTIYQHNDLPKKYCNAKEKKTNLYVMQIYMSISISIKLSEWIEDRMFLFQYLAGCQTCFLPKYNKHMILT